jgi:hypothetical protein
MSIFRVAVPETGETHEKKTFLGVERWKHET